MARPPCADGDVMSEGGPGAFNPSPRFTLGVELELMLLDRASGQLASESPSLLRDLQDAKFSPNIKAEITQSMIEINSGVHTSADALEAELRNICAALKSAAGRRQLLLCGGGAHPFRDWPQRDVFPDERFDRLQEIYGYLVKKFTVFGLHIHIGVESADDAIYLTQALSCLAPHFIALTAASPFQRGVDTSFQSSRTNIISMFPLSGQLPDVAGWTGFCEYFARMRRTGLVESMKDFYWDARPKPDFGTVELRVCDMPLTIAHAADIAALVQAVARRFLDERPELDMALQHDTYAVNRFKAAKSAWGATILDIELDRPNPIVESVHSLIDRCLPYCTDPGAVARLQRLHVRTLRRLTDADWMREIMDRNCNWAELMTAQCGRLLEPTAA